MFQVRSNQLSIVVATCSSTTKFHAVCVSEVSLHGCSSGAAPTSAARGASCNQCCNYNIVLHVYLLELPKRFKRESVRRRSVTLRMIAIALVSTSFCPRGPRDQNPKTERHN